MKLSETGRRYVTQIPSVRGRPKKFATVEELEEKIEAYFRSCFIAATTQKKTWIDGDEEAGIAGHFDYETIPATDAAGNQIYELIQQPTITGLAVALDTTRETLLDYENKPENADFSDTIKKAKAFIHAYTEQYLYDGKNQTSGIFVMKNNFGWVDRTETDLTTKGGKIEAGVVAAKAADILKPDADDQQG